MILIFVKNLTIKLANKIFKLAVIKLKIITKILPIKIHQYLQLEAYQRRNSVVITLEIICLIKLVNRNLYMSKRQSEY